MRWCQLCWIIIVASSLKHSLWVEILLHPDFKPMHFVIFFPWIFFYLNFMLYSENFWKCREQENISSNFHLVGLNFISIIDGWNNLSLYQYMSWVRGVVEHPWQFINWKSLDFLCIGWVPIFVWCCLNCSITGACVESKICSVCT